MTIIKSRGTSVIATVDRVTRLFKVTDSHDVSYIKLAPVYLKQKQCAIDTQLLQTTNRKSYILNQLAQVLMTSTDLLFTSRWNWSLILVCCHVRSVLHFRTSNSFEYRCLNTEKCMNIKKHWTSVQCFFLKLQYYEISKISVSLSWLLNCIL